MIWKTIKPEALFIAFFITYLVADFYPHPKLGKSLTERTFLSIHQVLTQDAAVKSKTHDAPQVSQRKSGPIHPF